MNLQKSPNQQNSAMLVGAGANRVDSLVQPGYCKPCGVKIRVGVFFDAFGRCVLEDRVTGQFSNIAKLWLAHNDMTSDHRPLQEIWFKLYYPGIGTYYDSVVNHELNGRDIGLLAMQFAKSVKEAQSKAEKKLKSLNPVEQVKKVGKDATKEGKTRLKAGLKDVWENRAGSKTYKEIAKEHLKKMKGDAFNHVEDKIGKFGDSLEKAGEHIVALKKSPFEYFQRGAKTLGKRVVTQAKGVVKDAVKNPLAAGKKIASGIAAQLGMEVIPVLRDSVPAAQIMGLVFETRFSQAQQDFEELLKQVKACPDVQRIHDIEVCVFGADRGAVMARAFVNELLDQYKKDGKAQFEGAEIRIKFMGLFDNVASLVGASHELLSIVPLIKKDFSEQKLVVPDAVQRCVHMIAAHEQRLYQRLDSLAKTKGEEYYYPGVTEDVAGGMSHGEDGFRDMLSRVPLQEMMMVAQSEGALFPTLEKLRTEQPKTFRLFDQSHDFPLLSGKTTNVIEMVRQYRKVAGTGGKGPEERLAIHQSIFLQWLHKRYKDAVFMQPIQQSTRADADEQQKALKDAKKEELDKQIAYRNAEREVANIPVYERTGDNPKNIEAHKKLGQAQKEMQAAMNRSQELEKQFTVANARALNLESLAERVDHEVDVLKKKRAWRNKPFAHFMKESLRKLPDPGKLLGLPGPADILPDEITDTQLTMLEAWERAETGKEVLPEEVIAMFDELVHDTLLVSWYDHLFAHHIYFDGRGVDYFGKSPEKKTTPTHAPRQIPVTTPAQTGQGNRAAVP